MKIALIKNKMQLSNEEYIHFPKGQSIKEYNVVNGQLKQWDIINETTALQTLQKYRCVYSKIADTWFIKEYFLVYYTVKNSHIVIHKIMPADELMYFIKTENTCEKNFLSSELNCAIEYFIDSELNGGDQNSLCIDKYINDIKLSTSFENLVDNLNKYRDILGDGKNWILSTL